MGYSQIKSVEVFNFMVYSHAVISFDDTNIINIKGYNSCGKSTMLRAVVVCLLNMYPKAQTKFIRHGEKYFRVIVRFDDGVAIIKDKYINGQSLYEIYRNDSCIYTSKEGGRLTRTDIVPQEVLDYLGMCVVSTGCLNYQVRQDPLWLIETTGTENYNSLNEILKTEEISRANSLLNSDKNKLNSEIVGIEASLQETNLSLMDIKDYTEEVLTSLKKRESFCKSLVSRYRGIEGILSSIEKLQKIDDIPIVSTVDAVQYQEIVSIEDSIEKVQKIKEYPVVDVCEYSRYSAISGIEENISKVGSSLEAELPDIKGIAVDAVESIINIGSLMNKIVDIQSVISALDEENTEVNNKISVLVDEAKAKGIEYVKCDNCGTYIEVKR